MRARLLLSIFILIAGHATGQQSLTSASSIIRPGADQLEQYLPLLRGQSVAVFANQGSRIGKTHLIDSLLKKGIHIQKIFAPEHGFRGDADAGERLDGGKDPNTGIPIVSLYGSKLRPSAIDLQDVDILLFDIQDVGVRFYTYISSLQGFIESAVANNRPLLRFMSRQRVGALRRVQFVLQVVLRE